MRKCFSRKNEKHIGSLTICTHKKYFSRKKKKNKKTKNHQDDQRNVHTENAFPEESEKNLSDRYYPTKQEYFFLQKSDCAILRPSNKTPSTNSRSC